MRGYGLPIATGTISYAKLFPIRLSQWPQTLWALGTIGNERAADNEFINDLITELIDELKDDDSDVRSKAAEELEEIGVVEALIVVLSDDEDSLVRWNAANALKKIGGDRAVKALIAALKDDDSHVRVGAVEALGEIGGDRAAEALNLAFKDNGGLEIKNALLKISKKNNLRILKDGHVLKTKNTQ